MMTTINFERIIFYPDLSLYTIAFPSLLLFSYALSCNKENVLYPSMKNILSISYIVHPFFSSQNLLYLKTQSAKDCWKWALGNVCEDVWKVGILTFSGGFKPHFWALSHLCNLVTPTHGPYFDVISNTLRISICCKLSQLFEGVLESREAYDVYYCAYQDQHVLRPISYRPTLWFLRPSHSGLRFGFPYHSAFSSKDLFYFPLTNTCLSLTRCHSPHRFLCIPHQPIPFFTLYIQLLSLSRRRSEFLVIFHYTSRFNS